MSDRTTTLQAAGEYYPRRLPTADQRSTIRGKIVLVRNTNRRQTMMDRLTNPYALGIYTGAAATGMITGMAMMARRQGNERVVSQLQKASAASFGMEEQKRAATTYRRRSKTGKISIVSKTSSSDPFPIIRDRPKYSQQ